jgi:hypothetical protein
MFTARRRTYLRKNRILFGAVRDRELETDGPKLSGCGSLVRASIAAANIREDFPKALG